MLEYIYEDSLDTIYQTEVYGNSNDFLIIKQLI